MNLVSNTGSMFDAKPSIGAFLSARGALNFSRPHRLVSNHIGVPSETIIRTRPRKWCKSLPKWKRGLCAQSGCAATARKLAVIVYRVLSGQLVYDDPGATAYQQLHRTRKLKSLRRRARVLGFHLVDQMTGEVLNAVSSKVRSGSMEH